MASPCRLSTPQIARIVGDVMLFAPHALPSNSGSPLKTYAAWSSEPSDVALSSSGGIATALARKVINGGGVVYGTASVNGAARCVSVDREVDLESLRGIQVRLQ